MGVSALPAGSIGVDYSFARPDPGALTSAGVSFVSRYLADGSAKVIDAAERDALFGAGLALLLNWEQSSGDFLVPSKGAAQGASAGRQAGELGYPGSLPIIVSCDSQASSSQYGDVVSYFSAFKKAAGWELGVYAQSGVANRLLAEGLVSFVWAPNATSWNQGVAYDRLDIQQFFGEKEFPALTQFADQIDPDRAEQPIRVWTGGAGEPATEPASEPAADDQTGTATTYTVKAGDSWWGIAETQLGSGTKDDELAAFNGKTIEDTILPGDVLKIPAG